MSNPIALVIGVSGQDGAYLARHLLKNGFDVHGTSRDVSANPMSKLQRLGIRDRVALHSVTLTDFRSVLQTLSRVQPDQVFNLAGQTSVGLSFAQPVETLDSIAMGTLNLLEAIRFVDRPIRFYNACSSECFGNTGDLRANEQTPFRPRSPYAVAKATTFWTVANYREAYGLFCCSGILSNHESPLRPERFVTQKIVRAACRIADGQQKKLHLGNLDITRDWGWAEEYVAAMASMLQLERPEDFVVASGSSHTLEDFVSMAFRANGLDWTDHVVQDKSLLRPTDIACSRMDPSKAKRLMNWEAKMAMPEVVEEMVRLVRSQQSGEENNP
ncbi:MAG: GDP-mannose 4,6-dehydratase [Planctomycetota bacterium]